MIGVEVRLAALTTADSTPESVQNRLHLAHSRTMASHGCYDWSKGINKWVKVSSTKLAGLIAFESAQIGGLCSTSCAHSKMWSWIEVYRAAPAAAAAQLITWVWEKGEGRDLPLATIKVHLTRRQGPS